MKVGDLVRVTEDGLFRNLSIGIITSIRQRPEGRSLYRVWYNDNARFNRWYLAKQLEVVCK